jgi:SAM-dependent methyltransferase
MQVNQFPSLCCPYCSTPLAVLATCFKCTVCTREFPAPYGIPCLAERRDYELDENEQQLMHQLLEDCEHSGWQQAIASASNRLSEPSAFLEYVVSPCRASWWPLLNLPAGCRALDFGCEWGAVSFGLAPFVGCVVSCDLNLNRLRFLKMRARQDGLSSLRFLCAGDTARLPFGDREFDLIILNGALDWVPLLRSGSPLKIQRALLRESARLLSSEGQLLLAVYNRWSWRDWCGKQEACCKLPFVSLVLHEHPPSYSSLRVGNPSRTHSHSPWTHKRLLRSAGFASSKAFVPLPDFHFFRSILDPADKAAMEHYFAESESGRSAALRVKARAMLLPLLPVSFHWVADRGAKQASYLDTLSEHISRRLHDRNDYFRGWVKFRVSRREVITVELKAKAGASNSMLKIPLSPMAIARTQTEQEILHTLWKIPAVSRACPEIPKPMLEGDFRDVRYYVQQALPGYSGERCLRRGIPPSQWKQQALDFIVRLHLATCVNLELDGAFWTDKILPHLLPGLMCTEKQAGIKATCLEDFIKQELVGHSWPFVFAHGDYWLGNLLFDEGGKQLLGVIDWDGALPQALPLLDLLHFLLSSAAAMSGIDICELIVRTLRAGLSHEDDRVVQSYLERMGFCISLGQLNAFVLFDWLLRVSVRVSTRHSTWWCEQDWLRKNVGSSGLWIREIIGPGSSHRSP